jgi:hypothetical protein
MTVALKFIDDLALARKMPLTLTNVALDVSKVIEKQRPFHAPQYPFSRGGGKRRVEHGGSPSQVVAGKLRRTRKTTKCDIEKFTMKLAITASSFDSHTGKSRTSTATTSAAVLANHPAMPDARKVK